VKNHIRLFAGLVSIVAVTVGFGVYSKDRVEATTRPQEPEKSAAASQQPAANVGARQDPGEGDALYGPSFASVAWTLFLDAMAPTNGSPTVESWTEQCELNPKMIGCPSAASMAAAVKAGGNGKVRMLHGSPMAGAQKFPVGECSPMTTTPIMGYPAPSNLTRNAMFCEEVYVNPVEADFVKSKSLTTLVGQQAYGNTHSLTINFPGTAENDPRIDLDSLEVKLDWAPATSFNNPTFACADPTKSLYTETINGTCFALVGIHVSAKVMLNWLWATFEPNNNITNPNRCDPRLYGACLDSWGTTSNEPYGRGQTAQQSPELRQAMAEAHLNPAFNNYFLTGVQTEFVNKDGKPTQLGNSFVEFNQGVPPAKSSCITCHKYAFFDGKRPPHGAPEDHFGIPPPGWPSIGYACNQNQNGNCTLAVPNSTSQDFSWILGLMPYSDEGAKASADQSDQSHSTPKNSASLSPIWPANQPPNQAKVSWDSRGLEIEAFNSSLNQILHQVAADTGAKFEGLSHDQRVFGSYGPGPGREVLLKFLDGSGYNVLMIGGRDADAPLKIILSAKSAASPQTAPNNLNGSNSEDDEAGDQPDPGQPPSQPNQDPFHLASDGPRGDPQQFMQEILGRQQKIDQQQQQRIPATIGGEDAIWAES
jgi:hypothetical protein